MRNTAKIVLLCGQLSFAGLLHAQAPSPTIAAGFGPGLSSEELARLSQTPGAKGDQQRHYYFEAAKKEMPYRLYVPQSYDKKKKTPLVLALHGYSGNQNYFFSFVKNLQELCDRYGFIYVAPLGYSTGSWYGAPLDVPGNLPRSSASSRPAAPPPPAAPQVSPKSPEQEKHERDLSEADVMNVLALVRQEYNIDSRRIYLMGHSMGGFGTYFLGQKYNDIWAAIAPMSGTMPGYDFQLDRLAKLPILVAAGSTETATIAAAKAQVETMKTMGMTAEYVEIEGGTHLSMIGPTVPRIFEFFGKQRKP